MTPSAKPGRPDGEPTRAKGRFGKGTGHRTGDCPRRLRNRDLRVQGRGAAALLPALKREFGARSGRAALGIASAVLLLAICAVPVLAAPAQEEPPRGATGGAGEVPAPSPAEVAAVEAKRHEEEEWLASPQALHERLVSQEAYSEITAGEARSLVDEEFPETMAALNEDPGRVLTRLIIEKPLGTYAAVVGNGQGEDRSLVESSAPVESELGGEGEQPVDLTLESSGGGFVPANPITTLELPGSAQGAIELGEEVKVGLPASDDHEAVPLGEENLFIPETETSTDTLLSPIADGVEISEQLRSEKSPEDFPFDLELPQGARMKSSGHGGAEIVSVTGAKLGEIPPPSAVDAQGASVSVELRVTEEAISMRVPHGPSAEIAYPILADPEILWEPGDFQAWGAEPGEGYGLRDLGSSLNAYSESNRWYSANTHAAWVYTAAGETAYVAAGYFSPVDFVDSCQAYQPHGYIGLYNVATGGWPALGVFSGGNSESTFETGWVGTPWTRYAAIGMATGEQKAEDTPCFHEIYVGGELVQEKDLGPPTINHVSGVPSGWFVPEEVGPATISTSDSGFGLHSVSIADIGGDTAYDPDFHECSGVYGDRCPLTDTWTIRPSYAEGERTLQVTAEDPIGQAPAPWTATTKVDLGKPEIEFGGQLAYVTEEEGPEEPGVEHLGGPETLSLPVYNLHVKATDGSNATAREKQSGVKRVAIYLDGALKEEWPGPECPQSSCPVEGRYTLRLTGLAGGVHKLKVTAEDWVHHLREREIEFEYFPATGESDEYVMQHFPLEAGEEDSGRGPELAVNLMNGNLVYHEQDLDLDTPSAALEVERQYNSETPAGVSGSFGTGWSLAQVPTLEEAASQQGGSEEDPVTFSESGGLRTLSAPTEVGGESFEPSLHRVITTLAKGRYELSGEAGQQFGTTVFDAAGAPEKQLTGRYSQIGYGYEDGRLTRMVAEDPAATEAGVAETEEAEGAGAPGHPVYEGSVGSPGNEAGEVSSTGGMALDSSGDLWVTGEETGRIEEFDHEGGFLRAFGSLGTGPGELRSPGGLTVDNQGDVWVADRGNTRIEEFGPEGEYIHQFSVAGTKGGLSASSVPSSVIDDGGDLWVSDEGAGRVDVFTPAGKLVKSVGAGNLQEPDAIATGPEGTIWVTDKSLDKVFEFNEGGTQLEDFGSEGEGEGEFDDPGAIAVDGEGHVWVADTGNGRVEEFDDSGHFLHEFGSEGEVAGRFSHPTALASDGEGHVWVAAVGNEDVEAEDNEEPESPVGEEAPEGSESNAPVAAWSFDEGSGTTAEDVTGHGHTATIEGAGWVEGKYGDGLEFGPEGGDMVTIPDSPELRFTEGHFTLEAWVKPREKHFWTPIMDKQTSEYFSYAFYVGGKEEDVPEGYISNQDWIEEGVAGTAALPLHTWSHVALTDDGSHLRLYVDGELVDTGPASAIQDSEGALQIGADILGGEHEPEYFDGDIDEVRVYDRALDQPEVAADMAAPLGGSKVGPVAAWSFDEGTGAVAHDDTGHGHEGTIEGTTWTGGRYGGALSFEEEEDCVSVPDSAELELGEEMTVEAWVDPDGEEVGEPIIYKEATGATGYALGVGMTKYGNLEGYVDPEGGTSPTRVASSEELDPHTWSHVALTYDGANMRLYIDGDLVSTKSAPGVDMGGEGPLTIGCAERGGSREWWDGRIDEVRVYDRALDGTEVAEDEKDPIGSEGAAGLNLQIQKWGVASGSAPGPVDGADPEVAFTTEGGQITAVQPTKGPEQQYQYEGDLLAAHTGPEGEASYEYDAHGRLDKVSLPSSATAEIAYEAIGRVSAVTVQLPGQEAKTTHFEYSDEPRETIVRLPEEPAMVYDIGADGSLLRWHNVASPPEIESLSGSLWEQRGEIQSGTITPGDQNLLVHAHSPEGIASVRIVADGNQLVEEETCEQDYEKAGTECINVPAQFVTETEDWSPGTLPLEVIVTDSLGHTESRRFWVDVPYTPPPPPGALSPPTFQATKDFREEYGLDPDLRGNKLALDERIFELINVWNDPNSYLGEVARASWERWGVPMRPVDVAELEYREWLYNTNAEKIDEWVEATQPANFAGYYLDNRAGGIMYVGFLGNQEEQLDQLKSSLGLVAPERIRVYPTPPTVSYLSEQVTAEDVVEAIESSPRLTEEVVSVGEERSGTALRIGTPDVAQVESELHSDFPGAHMKIEEEAASGSLLGGRYRTTGRMRAGDGIFAHYELEENFERFATWKRCTAGFGAKEKVGEVNGQATWRLFFLTAGHCTQLGQSQKVYRADESFPPKDFSTMAEVGEVKRTGYRQAGEPLTMDASAVRVEDSGIVPQGQWSGGGEVAPTQPAGTVHVNNTVCFNGATSEQLACGQVTEITKYWNGAGDNYARAGYWVKFNHPAEKGDSGAPVWSVFGPSIGIVDAYGGPGIAHGRDETFVEPLLTPPGLNPEKVYGALTDPHMRPLSLKIAGDGS
jgi:streptogramin lyase